VTPDHLEPALDKHLEYCSTAYEKDHRYRLDGTGDTITVFHSPPLVDYIPDNIMKIIDGDTPARPNTQGAQYLASQLSHLPLSDLYDSTKPNPGNELIDGAATCWLSPHHWFRTGSGFPV